MYFYRTYWNVEFYTLFHQIVPQHARKEEEEEDDDDEEEEEARQNS